MGKLVRCEICGEYIDRSECNQEYAILTTVKDTDKEGTKKNRVYLCAGCNALITLTILKKKAPQT